jgi:hypothetical protein
MLPGLRLLESMQGIGAAVVAAGLLAGAAVAGSLGSIGGAESVVNEVKGNLAPGKVVAVLRGDDVYRDEGVRTAADSSARLVLRDETVLTVGPSSLVKLDEFVYAGAGQKGAIGVNVIKGALVFATGDAEKHSYQITTPTAVLGVRGTVFRVEASASKTRVTLIEGAINVCVKAHLARCADLDHPGAEAVVSVTTVAVTDPTSPSTNGGTMRGATPEAPAAAPAPAPAAAPATAAPAAAPAAAAPAAAAPAAAPAAPGSPGNVGNGQGNGNGQGAGEPGNNGHGHGGNGGGNGH